MSDAPERRSRPSTSRSPSTAFDSADPPRNFTLGVGDRVRALTIGAPAFAVRKKNIEDLEAAHVSTLVAHHATHLRRGGDGASAAAAVTVRAAAIDLATLNAFIETHNRYYPIEANLPVSLRTGGYMIYGKPWRPEPMWTTARLVEHALAQIAERDVPED